MSDHNSLETLNSSEILKSNECGDNISLKEEKQNKQVEEIIWMVCILLF